MEKQSRILFWIGWALTVLMCLTMIFSATMKLLNPPEVVEQFEGKFGYPNEVLLPIAIVELACTVVFLIPRTAMLGAVLLTGYLGGAIATHVRVHDDFLPPVVMGVLVWLALFLRESRLRVLLPWRRSPS